MQFFEIAFSLLIRGKWGLIEHQYPPASPSPSWLAYSTYLYLDFHLLSRLWRLATPNIVVKKCLSSYLTPGMSVLDNFFAKYPCHLIE